MAYGSVFNKSDQPRRPSRLGPASAVVGLSVVMFTLIVSLLFAGQTVAQSPQPSPAPTSTPQRLILHGDRQIPAIALTFDACPGPGYDAAIVRILTETQTPATFFLSGLWMASHPSATQFLASQPFFELANHSWDHLHIPALSSTRLNSEITRTQQLITRLTGQSSRLFRFPYGQTSQRAIRAVYKLGLLPIQWDVVSGDPARTMTKKRIIHQVLSHAQNGSIVIMHVNGRGWHTAEALPDIITELHKRGFQLVTVSQLLEKH